MTTALLLANDSSTESTTYNTEPLRFACSSSPNKIYSPHTSVKFSSVPDLNEYRPLKLVKRGFRDQSEPLSCGIVFESMPAWLWALRLSDWAKIYITDTDELRLRQYHLSTWTQVSNRLKIVASVMDTGVSRSVNVWFLSGSRSFLDTVVTPDGFPRLMWIERCGRRRPPDTPRDKWFSVSHETVGGSTTARGVFGRSFLDNLEIEVDPLQRVISHILKFSIRPTPCSIPCPTAHYSLGQRLSVHHLTQPVVYETGFSRSGWGIRQLTSEEFAQAFDLPPYIPWSNNLAVSIVPIRLFQVVVDAALRAIRPQQRSATNTKSAVEVETTSPLPIDAEWIADLGLWLPGSWANTEIADKAVKSDDAEVEQYPWNQRILLAFPRSNTSAIRVFEGFGLKVWFRNLTASLFSYLSTEYGAGWRHDVQLYARYLRWERAGKSISKPLGKRKRFNLGAFEMTHDQGGGLDSRLDGLDGFKLAKESRAGYDQLIQDVQCGFRILRQVSGSSWWEWTSGSSLFFWRWNGREQVKAARDGIKIFVASALPQQRRQKAARVDPLQRTLVASKLDVMVRRDYLESGYVANTVHFFAVPKGDSDIRVVFDGTSSGLNETLWAPKFFLPSAKSAAMCLSFETWMADMDFGEMFHNFHMDSQIRPYSGIELGPLAPLLPSLAPNPDKVSSARPTKLRWTRLFMGMKPSPYLAIRHYYWGEEFARGNPARIGNPMGYDKVVLNLPGMERYDPAYPKVMKWKTDLEAGGGGHVAGDVVTFVDDVRATGYSKGNCWDVYHQFASRVQFLGMQNAPRKFRPPSQTNAGAWTGTIFKIGSSHITKTVSQEKWDKGRGMIERRLREAGASKDARPFLDRRLLERETGFLNHLSMTFETMVPYLKGFYLTLNSWREGRDENDWKLPAKRWRMIVCARAGEAGGASEEELDSALKDHEEVDAPPLVRASPSLIHDLKALWFMMDTETVPEVSIRSKTVLTIVYGFEDASGSGLGATFTCGTGFNFRIGVWGSEEDPESSN